MIIRCAHCGNGVDKLLGEVNRARKAGMRLFCGRLCSGAGRRKNKTKSQKIAEKADYDADYRRKNRARLKAQKAEYFRRTYDPNKARTERKRTMARHVEYCRKPEYRALKREYDRRLRAREYGPFAEVYLLSIDLNREIKSRASNEQIKWENGTANKSQQRKREVKEAERSRPRQRNRRSTSDPAAHS